MAAKIVQKLLKKKKQRRMDIAQKMLTMFNNDPDLLKKVTNHECLAMTLKPKPTSKWRRPEEPRLKKARQVRTKVKISFIVSFVYNGVVHYEFLPQGHTVDKEYYLEVMR